MGVGEEYQGGRGNTPSINREIIILKKTNNYSNK